MSKFTIPKILFENIVMKKTDKLLPCLPQFVDLQKLVLASENRSRDEIRTDIENLFQTFAEERIAKFNWVQDHSDGLVTKEFESFQDLFKKLGADKKFIKHYENLAEYNETLSEIGFLGPKKTAEDISDEFTSVVNDIINPTSEIILKTENEKEQHKKIKRLLDISQRNLKKVWEAVTPLLFDKNDIIEFCLSITMSLQVLMRTKKLLADTREKTKPGRPAEPMINILIVAMVDGLKLCKYGKSGKIYRFVSDYLNTLLSIHRTLITTSGREYLHGTKYFTEEIIRKRYERAK